MIKSENSFLPNKTELHDLEILFSKQNYDLLETKTKFLIEKYPNVSMLYNILGVSQSSKKMFKEAVPNFEKAIQLNPKLLDAYSNLGIVLKNLGALQKSLDIFQEALKINPNHHLTNFNLGDVYAKFNEIEKATSFFKKAIDSKSDFNLAYSTYLYFINYSDQYDANFFYNESLGYSKSIRELDKNLLAPFQYNKSETKLKIGFVSSDLRDHPIGYFLYETLKHLKNSNLELIAYSNLKEENEDNFTSDLKFFFYKWHKVKNMNDLELTNLIRDDKINLLIDLSGHSANNRLPIFINKPAPVQLTWAGYLDTTGLKEIDYIIADPFVVADKEQEKLFAEKVWKLPDIWNSFTKPNYTIEVATLPAIKNDFITFGSFNHLNKINNSVIKLWSKLLEKIPKSKLFLKYRNLNIDYYKNSIINKFHDNGINQDRLILEGSSPREGLLKTYNKIDISLDPFPYSGGTTSFESIWMGVPVLVLKGKKFISKCGESINHNLQMADWIAEDEKDFVSKAINICSNYKKLSDLRVNLRQIALNSPVFDAEKFAKNFHDALWKMWKIFLKNN
jgi:predicted O-linked N-acetylglucosamine transferase (SPINDLY family)